jgi:hypothetical protein
VSGDTAEELVRMRRAMYGPVGDTAARYQVLKYWLSQAETELPTPSPVTRYCLDMLLVKVARLLGNPAHTDTWRDIEGYCHLKLRGDR